MINSLKHEVCWRFTHKWGTEAFTSPGSCQMALTCRRCGDVRRTRIAHAWQEDDYAAPDSCQIPDICQRCGASRPGRVQHAWDELPPGGEITQKCQRCGHVQLEWPELRAVGEKIAATAVEIKEQVASVNETDNIKLQPLVAHWGPIVTHLLERVAAVTTEWHAPVTHATVVPLNITRSTRDDNSIVWKVEHLAYTELSASGSYFSVTLAVTEDYAPLNLQVLSKSFRFRTQPKIEYLQTALVRACVDGPAYWYAGIGGPSYSEADVREETIP